LTGDTRSHLSIHSSDTQQSATHAGMQPFAPALRPPRGQTIEPPPVGPVSAFAAASFRWRAMASDEAVRHPSKYALRLRLAGLAGAAADQLPVDSARLMRFADDHAQSAIGLDG